MIARSPKLSWSALALALASCGGGGSRVQPLPSPVKFTAANIDAAFTRLMAGDEGGARKQAKAILKRDVNNASARLLLDSLQRDPIELLGPVNYAYIVKQRDTITSVAERLLGNRFKAYQLLRYNKLQAPATLSAGQTLRIPGTPPRIESPRRGEPAQTRLAPEPSLMPAARPKPAAESVAAPANLLAARQARAAGLAALNQGAVARAVDLLRRAVALDPRNLASKRDLARAERIAATVRAKR